MSDNLALQLEVTQLRSQVSSMRTLVSRTINVLEQIQLALEEDDYEEALRIVKEARGES